MNILITSIGNKVNLAKYFRKALFNEAGGRIYGADCSSQNVGHHFVDEFLLSPSSETVEFKHWLMTVIKNYQIDLVVPSRDGDLGCLSEVRDDALEKHGCRILVADTSVLQLCLNKERFASWCKDHHFETPKSFSPEDVEQADLPLFIKPKIGAGSHGILKVDSWQQWLKVNPDVTDEMLIQKFIDAPEFTVDVFVDQLGSVRSLIPRERLITSNGESIHGKVNLHALIIDETKRLAGCLGLAAHNTIQCFLVGDQVIFTEVNARYGGGFSLGVEAGADTPRYIVQEVLGKRLSVNPDLFIDQMEMVRIQKDIFMGGKTARKVYCFDLDGTICTESCTYELAQPVQAVVEKVNRLYRDGHEIVIATARGASSGVSWRQLVEDQLQSWGVCYHKLVMEKPYADYYIDNKSVDVLEFI